MQTFLPYPNLAKSLYCLDYKRLGKQRVEAMQLIQSIQRIKSGNIYSNKFTSTGKRRKYGWLNHSATKMWLNYEKALMYYHDLCIKIWIKKGYNNNMKLFGINYEDIDKWPPWLGNKQLHASHRSNLLRKNKEYYSQYHWNESDNLNYIWFND